MSAAQAILAGLATIVLFLHALEGFSRQLREAGGERLERWLRKVTSRRVLGFLAGAAATAVVQSSSAVTALAVSLVESGVLSFRASLSVLLGANVGTTSTAWLVSFKLTGIGPFFLVLGALTSALPTRAKVYGQPLFYFGLLFFALDLVSGALSPLREQRVVMEWLARAHEPYVAVAFGAVFTALVQSSSVTTGLAIVFVQQGLLPPESAIATVIGANIGTTSTALLASLPMGRTARAAATANVLFNAIGALLLWPFVASFARAVVERAPSADTSVAWAHLVFNLAVALPTLALLGFIEPALVRRFNLARS